MLSPDANDKEWAPAVVNNTLDGRKYARLLWMHRECLEHLETGNDECVVIGHTDSREDIWQVTLWVIGTLGYGNVNYEAASRNIC